MGEKSVDWRETNAQDSGEIFPVDFIGVVFSLGKLESRANSSRDTNNRSTCTIEPIGLREF